MAACTIFVTVSRQRLLSLAALTKGSSISMDVHFQALSQLQCQSQSGSQLLQADHTLH